MNYIAILLVILSFNSFGGNPVSTGEAITAQRFNNQTFTVGDIKHSLLTITQFQTLMGDCWVKMEGQCISTSCGATITSDFSTITGKTTLPNASGKFLRGIGGNAPLLGEAQNDAFQGHHHQVKDNNGNTFGADPGDAVGTYPQISSGNNLIAKDIISDGENGTPRVSNETRPENIGVNYFIKINHTCN